MDECENTVDKLFKGVYYKYKCNRFHAKNDCITVIYSNKSNMKQKCSRIDKRY